MALKLTKDFSGVVFTPRKEESFKISGDGMDYGDPVLLQVSYGIGVIETEEG